jgi:hypothetical protein
MLALGLSRGYAKMSIQQQQITVDDLKSNWESDAAIDYPLERMPPWDAVCYDLNWRPFDCRILGPRFKKLSVGYPTGTLYIGQANPLSRRFTDLWCSLRRGYGNHGAPETLRYYARLNHNFPPNKLAIAGLRCVRCKYAEGDLLDAYINSFGEIPPLNLQWR